MNQTSKWKFLNLNAAAQPGPDSDHHSVESPSGYNYGCHSAEPPSNYDSGHHSAESPPDSGSFYLIALGDPEAFQKDLLYKILGPVFFGRKQAENTAELAALFLKEYGIDLTGVFFEGDEHYEEYQEACQALAEGMSIYRGSISFDNCILADLADTVWGTMEKEGKQHFRRINTLLEE